MFLHAVGELDDREFYNMPENRAEQQQGGSEAVGVKALEGA